MNTCMLAFLGWPEIVAILAVVLLLFGAKKLPELAKGLGKGINEFKKASREVQDEIERELLQKEAQRLRKKWIDRLRAKAFVRYF